jgi:hypothetical protein
MDPDSEETSRVLAKALLRNEQLGEAERVLRTALKMAGQNKHKRWRLHVALAEVLIRCGKDEQDAAIYVFKKSVRNRIFGPGSSAINSVNIGRQDGTSRSVWRKTRIPSKRSAISSSSTL